MKAPTLESALEPELRQALAEVRTRAQRFSSGRGGSALEVLREFDRLLEPLNGLEGRLGLFVAVHPEAQVREHCETMEREIAELRTELSLDRGLFERLEGLDEAGLRDPAARRLLAHAVRDFRRSGVDRDEATRRRVRELQEELVAIGQEFDRNIIVGGREFVVERGVEGLDGLPSDFLAAHPAREDGSIVLSTDPHVRMAVMSYAEDPELRRGYFQAATNRGVPENLEVLPRLLEKRHELARLLGYAHWADYISEDKMTRSAAVARAFMERLRARVAKRARAEAVELLEAKVRSGQAADVVHEWERAYLIERIKSERFDFDSLALRSYFPFARIKQGVLDTAAELFALEFRRDPGAEVWHPSVECWEILEGGEPCARFYLDLHPRDGKFKHAAMFPVRDGLAGGVLPEAVLVCNFPKPSDSDLALLVHDQVTTFFHEFGHLLHHVLGGQGEWLSQAGIATERDFVEVPSQLFEEWAWDADVLAKFAHHAETNEPIPREMVQRLRRAEGYGKGLTVETQLFFGLLALGYYDRDPAGLDLEVEMIALKESMCCLPHTPGTNFHASFGHLNGYSALYYTYLWSLVISKDLLASFQPDLMGRDVAGRYRRAVLGRGGSRDAVDMVREFLGREYGFEAFERWLEE